MNFYYFTYLMQEYGEKNIKKLMADILRKNSIEKKFKTSNPDFWNFNYFFSLYLATTLKYFGLTSNQINFCLDLVIAPGWNELFEFENVFEIQKNNIPKIEKLIKEELKRHHS